MTSHHPPYLLISGPGAPRDSAVLEAARTAGRAAAELGWFVLTGGLRGVMAAAAEGVQSAGGTAIALLPGTDRRAASAGHDIVLPTGLGELRNGLLVRCADAVLVLGESWGALSELALAAGTDVPVAAVGVTVPPIAGNEVIVAPDVDTALQALRRRIGG